jgi:hypothetical protein
MLTNNNPQWWSTQVNPLKGTLVNLHKGTLVNLHKGTLVRDIHKGTPLRVIPLKVIPLHKDTPLKDIHHRDTHLSLILTLTSLTTVYLPLISLDF